jgi:hypothetical protein
MVIGLQSYRGSSRYFAKSGVDSQQISLMDDGAVSVASKLSDKRRSRRSETVRSAALQALGRVLEPLAGFLLDTGLSVQEAQAVLRSAAVHGAAKRQRKTEQRVSISGIAASTGISRAEISRLLRAPARESVALSERRQQATNRILAAWQDDPTFTKPNGQPATLKIYGEGVSFDALVKAHGRGLPTRAMLDELVRAQAVTLMSAQRVRVKALAKAKAGVNAQSVKVFGERAEQVLATMLEILRDPEGHQFVISVEGPLDYSYSGSSQSANLYARCKDLLRSSDIRVQGDLPIVGIKRSSAEIMHANVIVCYTEKAIRKNLDRVLDRPRKNLRRSH